MSKIKLHYSVLFVLLAVAVVATGCRYDMQDQPRHEYYEKSEFFANEMASRPIIEGTVPRGYLRLDKPLYTGKRASQPVVSPQDILVEGGKRQTADGTGGERVAPAPNAAANAYPDAVTEFPLPVTKELIDRGEERYRIHCIVCHGPLGEGDGMVVRRGFTRPPSFHTEQLRGAPVGHFFDVITNGWGRMSSYASQVQVADRWAIVAYIRALQATNPNLPVQGSAVAPAQTPAQTPATPAATTPGTQAPATQNNGGRR